jgi:hypothetical protein
MCGRMVLSHYVWKCDSWVDTTAPDILIARDVWNGGITVT